MSDCSSNERRRGMKYQIRNHRGQKLVEFDGPMETVKWIQTKAVGFIEVWTLKSSPGPLVRVEQSHLFLRRHNRNNVNKKTPKPGRSRSGVVNKQMVLKLWKG